MKRIDAAIFVVLSTTILTFLITNYVRVEAQAGEVRAGTATVIVALEKTDPTPWHTSVITPGVLTFHEADATIAYNWFSYVPRSVNKTEHSYIWLTGLHGNLISDDYNAITAESQQQAAWRTHLAERHQYIMLVPVIPRPATNYVYAVAFDWKVFLPTSDPFVQRPDIKVNLMIDRLVTDLRQMGYDVDDKVFVDGFSAGAMFAQRYALLQPERIRAIAAGQCGGAMTLPESTYASAVATAMEWPVGVSDFSSLVGEDFDRDAYQQVSQLIYIGDQDTTNSTLSAPGEPGELWRTQAQIDFLNAEFGNTDPVRLEGQASYLADLGYDVSFKLYPGVGHQFTNRMIDDTFAFFREVRQPRRAYLPIVEHHFLTPLLPILIDGDGEDWSSYTPVATDSEGDTRGGPGTDMKAVYAEDDEGYLYIMVNSYDPPLSSDATIELNMNITDQSGESWWLHTNIVPNGSLYAWTDLDGDGELEYYDVFGEQVAWGDVMEMRIPLSAIQSPEFTEVTWVVFWTHVNGQWIWVDIMHP